MKDTKDTKDTKDLILKTAYNMFLYNNYEAVTINSIIKATGLTKGGIYYYFNSKEEIFKAVVNIFMIDHREDISKDFCNLKALIQNSIASVRRKITKMVIENKDYKDEVPINYLSLMLTACRYYPGFGKIGRDFINGMTEVWTQTIKKAIEDGEVNGDIDIEATVANFLQVSSGIVGNMIMGGSMIYALDMMERQYWELYNRIRR
ncbi:MAG TPA: TetR/AcrR family transcriptional regulator [Bacteroidales bacterium]|nr:TetR/AcrR family transcriptional regulator [Bacteroidales bacterium]HPT20539.1 TetR/AcrR family transcriptional regulator [Bacteroidales bacterium]